MTSPAQLKYLDAMGIPVWVSRDIVIDVKNVVGSTESFGKDLTNTNSSVEEKLPQKNLGEKQSASSLLEGLNSQSESVNQKITDAVTTAKTKTAISQRQTIVNEQAVQSSEIGRTVLHTVYACGSLQADWMVIGESPETVLDRKNQPFEGDTGILICNMLRAVGIENPRDNAYLINILKTVHPQTTDADQSSEELNQLLINKIEEVKPKIIIVVGRIVAQNLLKSKEPLARLRAKVHQLPNTEIPLIATYYPSWLLSKPTDKRKAWEDLKLAMRTISPD